MKKPNITAASLDKLKVELLSKAKLADQGAAILRMTSDIDLAELCSPEELQAVTVAFRDPGLMVRPNILKWWQTRRRGHVLRRAKNENGK